MAKTGQADTGKVQEAIVAKFGAPDSPYQVLWATTFLTIVVLYTCPALTSMYTCPAPCSSLPDRPCQASRQSLSSTWTLDQWGSDQISLEY